MPDSTLFHDQTNEIQTVCFGKRQVYIHTDFGGPKVLAVRIAGQACINVYR